MTGSIFEDIMAVLPPEWHIKSISTFGDLNWAEGFKLALVPKGDIFHGEVKEFFVKLREGIYAEDETKGEFESTKVLADALPGTVVAPLAWGTFSGGAFLIEPCRHLKPYGNVPHAEVLAMLRKLRETTSPDGKFGFHVDTFFGPQRQPLTEWSDSWEEIYLKQFWAYMGWARESLKEQGDKEHSDDPELFEDLAKDFAEKVIPRLLRPLQTGGRSIRPALCHGDLYDKNLERDEETGKMATFDSACYYGHAESDLKAMLSARWSLRKDFVDKYAVEIGVDEPKADFADRIAMYSVHNEIVAAALLTDGRRAEVLKGAKETMARLVAKYPDGIDCFQEVKK